jgi:hypothetical protein
VTQEYKRQPLPEWSEVLAEKDAEIAALNHAEIKYLVCIEEKDLEIKMLRTRLEVDERHPYDGIYCRDETIRLQDTEIGRLRSMIVVQEAIIRWDEAEIEKLRAALVRWLDAVNDKRAFEHHQPDNLGKEWSRLREAVDLAEDKARAALSGDKHE